MRAFRYGLGHEAVRTMTVAELRAKLTEYSDDMPVFGAWEGVAGPMWPEDFEVRTLDWGFAEDACACLLIDVDTRR